jgi:VanZ family protein
MKKKTKYLAFVPAIVWMGVIFYFSNQQRAVVSDNYIISFIIFKTLHLIEYGVLFMLWRFALKLNIPYKKANAEKLAVIISIIYAVTDEFHQTLVPTREGTIRDVFIDTLGIFITFRFLMHRLDKLVKTLPLIKEIYPD